MKKIARVLGRFFNVFVILSAFTIIGGLIFLYTFPFNVAQLNKINLKNDVQAGGRIEYNVDFCRYVGKGTEIHTRRFLVAEDKGLTNPIELSSNPSLETLDGITGCRTSDMIKLPIDTSVPQGKYKLLIQARYCIFLGRCITVEGYSDPFDISRPSIPNQLSSIKNQLDDIQEYIGDTPQVTNTASPQQLPQLQSPEVSRPNAQPVQTQPSLPSQPITQEESGLITGTLNDAVTTVRNLIHKLGV